MPVAGQIQALVSLTASVATNTLGSTNDVVNVGNTPLSLADGTGDNQVRKLASGTLSLAANTPQTLDLTALVGGTGTQVLGAWKLIYLYNPDTSATKVVTVGPGDTNPATIPTVLCYGGSPQLLTRLLGAGTTVDATHKTIKIDPGANAQTLQYIIAGT